MNTIYKIFIIALPNLQLLNTLYSYLKEYYRYFIHPSDVVPHNNAHPPPRHI